ncbi:GMC family oxidoreductase N-terminal domain-containing protein [Patulibacter brassicae]|uniref:GMC family oxidoreductase N-terminal domain-containing protein n=1 Tax=Patulibacter brassicae TaxID=1705717 RepID=A0ABU4VR57_9ACTN|nr:GMC family oxidoreductase N-terminal domain-containing protein [Patulibacter brassicae]MDX8153275.1 GMC family oxidoreductase N-terminal domain-containing protein [Patulibacter brassicae]
MSHYIVVGAGSAGCALAARLTEDPAVEVTLIEAGGQDDADEIHVPAAFGSLMKSRFDWDFDSEPEPALAGRRLYLPRGRVVGGSSSINAMIYIRGNRADWDGYAAAGATGWGYEDVLPYFKRSETNERGANEYHGADGPLTVSENRSRSPLMQAWVAAAREAGLAANEDFNAESQDGVGFYQVTQRDGRRWSTAQAFLRPALDRPNLELVTDALVHRVVVEGGRAVGVELYHDGRLQQRRAEVEVILAAGAYGSPQLLLLSGIGPAAELAPLGIDVVADLPEVGEHLTDHPMSAVGVWTDTESLLTATAPHHLQQFAREGRGPLTSNFAEAGGFLRTDPSLDAPNVQFHAAPAPFVEEGLAVAVDHAWVSSACLLTPESRGKVSLRAPIPSSKPRIVHRYFESEADRAAMIEGVRRAMQIAEQPALAPHVRERMVGAYPASDSDEDVWAHIQRTAQTLYHPAGTCGIGRVVDAELRVQGVEGLRVADASVLPVVPRGNTNAPAIVVGEKAADLLRGVPAAQAADRAEVAA